MDISKFENELNSLNKEISIGLINESTLNFEVVNRTINMFLEIVDILVEGDTNSRIITFKVPRYFDGVDLASKNIRVNYLNALGKSKESTTKNSFVNVDNFVFDWVVPGEATVKSGLIKISLAFSETNNNDEKIYIWQTKPAELNVEECFTVFNDADLPDYSYQKYFYDLNNNSTVYGEIIDDDAPISVIGRRILMPVIEDFIVSKDTMSQIVSFKLPRFFDNVDLSKRVIAIKFINAAGGGDRSKAINVITFEESIVFGWLIDGNVTVKEGHVQFAIEFLGYTEKGEFFCWQTVPAQLLVAAGLDVDSLMPPPTPSWVQSWELATDKLIKDIQSQVDDSKLSATNAKSSEVAAKLSETNSKDSENESIKQAQIATEKAVLASEKSVEASDSAEAALLSETNAKESEDNSKQSETNAKSSENVAIEKSIEAIDSANLAVSEANRALVFADIADEKAASAQSSATLSQSEAEKSILASSTASDMASKASESMSTANEAKEAALLQADRAEAEANRAALIADNIHDIREFELYSELPRPGEAGKIYTIYADIDTVNGMYRWDGVDYAVISSAAQVQVDNKTIVNTDNALSTVAVIESNANSVNKFWSGTKDEYNSLENKLSDTTYFVTDDVSFSGTTVVTWEDINDKPSVFPPDKHDHDQLYPTVDRIDTMQTEVTENTNVRHDHNNKSILDGITANLVSAWDTAVTHISDVVKHVTEPERTLWNTVSDKANLTDVDAALSSLNVVCGSTAIKNGSVFTIIPNTTPVSDIFTLTFKAPADFVENDTLQIDNYHFSLYKSGSPAKMAFVQDEVVTINFDKSTEKAFFRSGGGGDIELPPDVEEVQRIITVPKSTYSMTVDSIGNIYTGGSGNDRTLRKLSPEGIEIWKVIFTITDIFTIVVDKDNNIFVGGGDLTLKKYSPDGTLIWDYTEGSEYSVYDIDIDIDGNIYTGGYDKTVRKISQVGETIWGKLLPTVIDSLKVDNNLNIYACGRDNQTYIINERGGILDIRLFSYYISDITIDSQGMIYLCGNDNNLFGYITKTNKHLDIIYYKLIESGIYKSVMDKYDNIYIVLYNISTIEKLSFNAEKIWEIKTHTISANGIALDNNLNVYVASHNENYIVKLQQNYGAVINSETPNIVNKIYKFDTITEEFPNVSPYVIWEKAQGSTGSEGLTTDKFGNVYAVNNNYNIVKYSSTGIQIFNYVEVNKKNLQCIKVDEEENMYVGTNNDIRKLSSTGELIWLSIETNGGYQGVTINKQREVYGLALNATRKFSFNGEILWENTYYRGRHIALDSQDYIYISDAFLHEAIHKLYPDGHERIWWNTDSRVGIAVDSKDNIYGIGVTNVSKISIITGKSIWSKSTHPMKSSSIAVDNVGNIYVGAYGYRTGEPRIDIIFKFSSIGDIIWEFDHFDSGNTPHVAVDKEGNIFSLGPNMYLNKIKNNMITHKIAYYI